MNAARALQLYKQLVRINTELHNALPSHPAAKDGSETKDYGGKMGKAAGHVWLAKERLMDAVKDMAVEEIDAKTSRGQLA